MSNLLKAAVGVLFLGVGCVRVPPSDVTVKFLGTKPTDQTLHVCMYRDITGAPIMNCLPFEVFMQQYLSGAPGEPIRPNNKP